MAERAKADFDVVWDLVRQSIEDSHELSDTALNLWFSDIRLAELTSEKALFTVATKFKYDTIKNRYTDLLERHLERVIGYSPEVEVVFDDTGYVPVELEGQNITESPVELAKRNIAAKKAREAEAEAERAAAAAMSFAEHGGAAPDDYDESSDDDAGGSDDPDFMTTSASGKERLTYNPDYTFENFVVGASNTLAHAAARAVAANPADKYNPFFIYGPSGVGKTHLMYAITNEALERNPQMKITYVKGETFANQLIESMSKKYGGVAFREKYRTVDMLLIDDVHFISGRNAIQEEFFHTFNALFEDHKQIVVSSDRPPKDMPTLEARIRSRFESGLLADIQAPDYDLRLAIMRKKAETMGLYLRPDVEKFLAESVSANIRQIEGVIKKLSAVYYLNGETPTIDTIKNHVPEFLKEDGSPEETADRIITAVSKHFGIPEADLRGASREKNIKEARNTAMFLIRNHTPLSLSEIGKLFGGRNHSTVHSNCVAAEARLETDRFFESDIKAIEDVI